MPRDKEMVARLVEEGHPTKEGKYNTKEGELVEPGDWGNSGQSLSRLEDDYYIFVLCYLVDNAKVNQDWEYKREAGYG